MHRAAIFLGVFIFVTAESAPAAKQADTVTTAAECTEPPSNLEVDERVRRRFVQWLGQSKTLRRQCGLIATATSVRVRVVDAPTPLVGCRARTTIARHEFGALRAVVELPQNAWQADLLAHELEHVIEQMEGLNLPALARQRRSGVREWGRAMFETARARAVGRQVAAEIGNRYR